MPKSKGKNAFYFFMLDWKKSAEKNGKKFPEGLKDVQRDPECSEDWQNLSSQERGYYNKKAKDDKIASQGSCKKKTVLGENIEEVLAAEEREKQFHEDMLQYIESVVDMGSKHKNLEKLKFIFVHVNLFFTREIGINKYEFCPAEFAVGEFSLANGVENIYHEIVDIKIPLGWKRDALEISQQTHKIPVQLPEGQSDFTIMYNNVIALLEKNKTGNKLPPVFTIKKLMPAVNSLLERMANVAGASADGFLVYSLEALFGALRNASTLDVTDRRIPLVVAEHEFAKDTFSSARNTECDFHKAVESSEYCSMSIIRRWGFTICDYCCEFLGVLMVEGVHYPISLPIDSFYEESAEQDRINSRLKYLSLNNQPSVIEWNGVTEEHRIKVSERTYADELRRRAAKTELTIIDHSIYNAPSGSSALTGRPLRIPSTAPLVLNESKESDCLNAADFPPLGGKDKPSKKNAKNFPLGRGRGST